VLIASLFAECGTDSVWGQPQMEPLWTPYRDVLMPSKSRAKRTLLGQGICSKGGGRLAQPIGNADALPSKEVGIHRPSAWSEQCQGGTEGSQQGTTPRISRLREGVPRARTGTSCRLACRQGQTRITGLTTRRSYPGGAGIEFHCPIHRGVQRIPVHDDAHYVGSSNGRVPRFRSS
jgi:hypothetical protein